MDNVVEKMLANTRINYWQAMGLPRDNEWTVFHPISVTHNTLSTYPQFSDTVNTSTILFYNNNIGYLPKYPQIADASTSTTFRNKKVSINSVGQHPIPRRVMS